ncbi:conserved hypothetical protein [Ricinus communis]|uniref:Uncharacterized protein n=1 Tax=Ricinus communis TaxID=3988 RepID=B9S5K4_RICCO|nr:conserved hypothetical protein [Ricinus communis]
MKISTSLYEKQHGPVAESTQQRHGLVMGCDNVHTTPSMGARLKHPRGMKRSEGETGDDGLG